jgi:hypothetical protein
MSKRDYYPCDVCGEKTFYDADVDIDCFRENYKIDLKVICGECSKNYDIHIVKKNKKQHKERDAAMNKSCRTCKYYNHQYGCRNGKFVGHYVSCDFSVDVAKKCKKDNFSKWEEKDDE